MTARASSATPAYRKSLYPAASSRTVERQVRGHGSDHDSSVTRRERIVKPVNIFSADTDD